MSQCIRTGTRIMQFSGKTLAWLILVALAAFTVANSPTRLLS